MPRTNPQAKRLQTQILNPNWIVPACALLLCAVTLGVHAYKYPDFSGFWAGVDQQRYLESARAWANLDLSPARHHYPPFYPLVGAAFAWVTPWQPFMLPDLACLLAGFFVFLHIGRRLAPTWPPACTAACFTVAVLSGRTAAAVWVVPWSTTGAAPFQLLALLLALRFAERPSPWRAAWLALSVALIGGFRPSDAAILAITTAAYATWAACHHHISTRTWLHCGAAAAAGMALGLTPTILAHLAIFGWSPGPYLSGSASTGFEWRLLPLRWVMIVISPRPMLPEGAGLAGVLPWIAPGIAGMLLALTAPRRSPTILVAGTVTLHWALYLAYRDLQPYGLWRFYNIHYFKWTFPFLVLWAAQLVQSLATRRTRLPATAVALATLLFFTWRPILRKPITLPATATGRSLSLPNSISRLDQAIRLPLAGAPTWNAIYFGDVTLQAGGRTFLNTPDFKIMPVPGGALLIPLRRLPAGPATLHLPSAIATAESEPAELYRQAIVFGLPCLAFNRLRPACR